MLGYVNPATNDASVGTSPERAPVEPASDVAPLLLVLAVLAVLLVLVITLGPPFG